MTAATLESPIAAFAASVRAHLDDLPADEADDLLEGLEADLAEQAAETEDFELPDAAAYAAELRSAAGLPARTASETRVGAAARARAAARRWLERLESNRAASWLLELAVALRPVWWVLRGWALFVVLSIPLGASGTVVGFPGGNLGGWLLLGSLVLLSIQWGRGRWAPTAWLRGVRVAASVVAGLILPFALAGAWVTASAAASPMYEYVDATQPGLSLDGERVRNIYAYDAEGQPIEAVQLFDQNGRPLTTVGTAASGDQEPLDYYFFGGAAPVPVAITVPGRSPVWNVFPLAEIPADAWEESDPADAIASAFPFPFVPAIPGLVEPEPTPTPTSTPTDGAGSD